MISTLLSLLALTSSVHGTEETHNSYEKTLSCSFKVENENHSFDLYRQGLGGQHLMILMRNSLYTSSTKAFENVREAVAAPMDFQFKVGHNGNGDWQSQITVHLDKMSLEKGKRVRAGKGSVKVFGNGQVRDVSDLLCVQT